VDDDEEATVSIPDKVETGKTEEVGQTASTANPVQDDPNIWAAWQVAAPLWPAWLDLLEAEEQAER
jgi:hypothetical protein